MAAALFLSLALVSAASGAVVRYVAPQARGAGDGASESDAADFRSPPFWLAIDEALRDGPVRVEFVAGTYYCDPYVRLADLGHPDHRLTLQGAPDQGTIFRKGPADGSERPDLFVLIACRNVLVRDFHFRGDEPIGYAFRIRHGSRDIVVEDCTWIDMHGIYYGATGAIGVDTSHVTYRNCTFKRIGSGAHAHMIYFSYEPKYLTVEGCHFEDCAGDFVRFRAGSDHGRVLNSTFISTGDYANAAWPFVSVPLFNDDNPAHPPASEDEKQHYYEYFGTDFVIAGNRFVFPDKQGTSGRRFVFQFYHKGYSPPGREHLLTTEEAAVLRDGSPEERRRVLREMLNIEPDRVRLYDNEYVNAERTAVFGSFTGYGSLTRGWTGYIDIHDLLNHEPPGAEQDRRSPAAATPAGR